MLPVIRLFGFPLSSYALAAALAGILFLMLSARALRRARELLFSVIIIHKNVIYVNTKTLYI